MRVVHDPTDGDERTLATTVETADSFLEHTRGLMFRKSIPDDYALVFDFVAEAEASRLPWASPEAYRSIHMLFVRIPLDVLWLLDGEVRKVKTLAPWRGLGLAKSDTIVELPAGAADGVEPGDRVRVVAEAGSDSVAEGDSEAGSDDGPAGAATGMAGEGSDSGRDDR